MGNVDSCSAAGRRRPTGPLAAAAAAAVVLMLAGCGGSSPQSTATTSGNAPGPGQGVQAAYKFATCMRNHGVANFPDPKVTTSPGQVQVAMVAPATFSSNPHFKTASKACNSILPQPSKADLAQQAAQQRAHTAGLLSFAKCVRDHGINGFPDPDSQGRLTLPMLTSAGVDVHAPQVLAAARACIPASDGTVNAAAIQQVASSGSGQGAGTGTGSQASATTGGG